ncbi:MAG TPA: DoxX family membrane protein [Flavobacterium sp.]|nr:DoxX family membrane protein [Flavobacterium sp.]
MKITTIIVRVLLGALFLFASISYFFTTPEVPPMTGNAKLFMDGINASGYLMNLVKVTELICGLALASGFFTPLANLAILPVTVNILFVHICVFHAEIPMAVGVFLANVFLIYAYRNNYTGVFSVKQL